jgi:hypothetical protein
MSSETLEPGINRRRFIKASVAAAATATVAGAGAALLRDKQPPPKIIPQPRPVQQPIHFPTDSNPEVEELFSRLASVQAENVRLESQLNITKRQLEDKRSSILARDKSESESIQTRFEEMNLQVGVLSGLVALYDQLDEIDLDDIVDNGLNAVGDALDELVDNVPTVSEGLQMGQAALDELEQHIPLIEDGRDWLDDQLGSVDEYYSAIERALSRVVEGGGSFIQMLNEWFQGLLKWLPFGIGNKAIEVMDSLSNLVSEIPGTLTGINANVVQPLDVWLEKDGDQTALQKRIISPVRERAIEPAIQAMDSTEALRTTYRSHLADPARLKLESKRAIRNSINEYRSTHQA